MTELPPAEIVEETQYRHNWLYSVLPITKKFSNSEKDTLYLAGYCRACDNAFSVEIPRRTDGVDYNNDPLITSLGVPKWGCISPTAGL